MSPDTVEVYLGQTRLGKGVIRYHMNTVYNGGRGDDNSFENLTAFQLNKKMLELSEQNGEGSLIKFNGGNGHWWPDGINYLPKAKFKKLLGTDGDRVIAKGLM